MAEVVRTYSKILGKVNFKGYSGTGRRYIEEKNRLVVYEQIGERVDARLNEGYINELRTKMLNISDFIVGYEIFESILDDFKRNVHEFERDYNDTGDLVRGYQTTIDEQIVDYTKRRDQGQKDFWEYTKNYPALNLEVEETDKNLLIDMFDKTKAYWHVVQTKEYEREKAQKIASADGRYIGSMENLEHLVDVKEILEHNHFSKFSDMFQEFRGDFAELSTFRQNIQERGNLLEKEHNDIPELLENNINHLLPYFEKFHELYLKVIRIKCELEYHKEFLILNDRKLEIAIKIAGEEKALPFLNQQQQYFERRVDAAQEEIMIYELSDKTNHLQNCMDILNRNLIGIDRDIHAIQIVGGVTLSSGFLGLGSDGLPRHNLELKKNDFNRPRPDVDNFQRSDMVNLLRAKEAVFKQQLDLVLKEKMLLDIYRKEYSENEAKIKENEDTRESKYTDINNKLVNVKASYEKLKNVKEVKDFDLSIDYLCSLLGLYLSHVSVNTYRKCHRGPSQLQTVDIDPKMLLDILGGILKKRVKFAFCSSTITNIFNCQKLLLTEYLDLVLDFRTGSCLKNSKGYKQSINDGFRDEDINDSLFNCLTGYARVLVLAKQNEFQINMKNTREKIMELEQKHITILIDTRHKNLAERFNRMRYPFKA